MKKPSSKSSIHTRFVPDEEIDVAKPWQFGAVSDVPLRGFRSPERQAADAELQRQTLQREREQGLAEGYAKASAEFKLQLDDFYERQAKYTSERMLQCIQDFETRWSVAEQELAQGVIELACALARQVVRRELQLDKTALLPVILEAIEMLGQDAKAAVIRLNPEEYGLLDANLRQTFAHTAVSFRPDPEVAPGGCLVEAGSMSIDGALSKRWSRAIAALGMNLPWQEAQAPDA